MANREHLDSPRRDPVDDTVIAIDELSNLGPVRLGNDPTTKREVAENLRGIEQALGPAIGRGGIPFGDTPSCLYRAIDRQG